MEAFGLIGAFNSKVLIAMKVVILALAVAAHVTPAPHQPQHEVRHVSSIW